MILGIAGTHGAGKGAVVDLLKEHGFIHCSARELFLEILKERNSPLDRASISALANELRAEHGVSYVVDTYLARHTSSDNVIIESIYTLGEVEALRKRGGVVLAVDADPEIRYERIKGRMSETDFVTKEDFIAQQQKELHSDDPSKQNTRAVMETADFRIENNGSLEELKESVAHVLKEMEK